MKLQAILFDLDETLLDRTTSLQRFVTAQHAAFPALQHIPLETYVHRFIELDAYGHTWKDFVYRKLIIENDVVTLTEQELLDDYLVNFARFCVGFPYLRATLEELSAAGYRLGVITNGPTPFQERNFAALGVADLFEVVTVSAAVNLRKPDPAIFAYTLAQMKLPAHAALYVGDNPKADIAGAKAAGMRAIWRANPRWPKCDAADAVVHELNELPGLVASLAAAS